MYPTPSRLLTNSLLGFFLCCSAHGAAPIVSPAVPAGSLITIIIDDLGHTLGDGRRVIALPAPVALAILPHTLHGAELADEAYRARKEILLHLPMDPDDGAQIEAGPGRIENHMSASEITAMVSYDLQTVPHVVGVNNHMGSRITQNATAMTALMRALRRHGNLYFLDSRTTPRSLAARVGAENDVRVLERDVFLDNERGDDNVWHSIQRAERLLAARGHAIVIGHPYPETLAALERWIPTLAARGIRVVAPSVMLNELKRLTNHAERPASTRPGL